MSRTVRQRRHSLMRYCVMVVFFTALLVINIQAGHWYNYLAAAIDAIVVILSIRLVWLTSSDIASQAALDLLDTQAEIRAKDQDSGYHETYEHLARNMIHPN